MVIWDRDFGFSSDPFRELDRIRRTMDSFFSKGLAHGRRGSFPPVNIWSNNEKAVVKAEVPGLRREDIDLSVENDVLTIKGHREPEQLAEGDVYHRQERGYGTFRRSVGLPFAVDPDRVKAGYEDGVLRIELTRHEASKPRQIEIK